MKDKTGLALAGGVLSALAASLCCVVPLLAVGLGASGLTAANAFAPWRPYFLVATFGLLGLGFYLSYRASVPRACDPASHCRPSLLGRWSRPILWLATALAIVFATFPYYSGWVARAAGRSLPGIHSARTSAHLVVKVDGMDCIMCAGGLRATLRQIPGVRHAEVNFQDKQAMIDYDPRAVDPSRFLKVIADSGFRVAGSPQISN